MNRGYIYLIFSVIVAGLSFLTPWYIQIILTWIALSSLYYAIAYLRDMGEMLFKSKGGRLPIYMKIAMFPILLGATVFNLVARSRDKVPPLQKVADGLWLSRRLVFLDLQELKNSPISAILDVTAEFDAIESHFVGKEIDYLNIPVMDHNSPRLNQLEMAVRWIDQHRKKGDDVLIHCALGQGRSVTVLLAYMKFLNPDIPYPQLVEAVRKIRPNIMPNRRQYRSLELFGETLKKKSDEMHIICNPNSGSMTDEVGEKIRELLKNFFDVTFHYTTETESADQLSKKLVESGKKFIVAAGGDGTVTQVAQPLVNTDTLFGVIPLGTGNALAAILYGAEARVKPIETACQVLAGGKTKKIDVAKVNNQYMILLAGVGLERGMTENAEGELKDKWGPMGYVIGGLQYVENFHIFEAEIIIDGKTEKFQTGSITIANTAPKTSILAQGGELPAPDDGLLDVTVIVEVETKLQATETLMELMKNGETENTNSHVQHFQAKKVELKTNPVQKLVIDGEIENTTPAFFEMVPKSLRVCYKE